MDAPADPPPGCLVVLVRLSADMAADVTTGRGESVAIASARLLADELIEWLVTNYETGPLDAAVLGYRTSEDGVPQLISLLPDGDPKPRLVPLAQLAQMPAAPRAGEDLPRKWAVLPVCSGEPCAAPALARVYHLLAVWLTGRFAARPPVVVHCTAAGGLDTSYFRTARSLTRLATGFGPPRLLHHIFDAAEPDPGTMDLLREVSAELPASEQTGLPARRGPVSNDWALADHWDALFTSEWRASGPWPASGGFAPARTLWAEKLGNTPEQWEDACATDAPGGAVAVADGASTGIYCRIWADQLCRAFLAERPDARDPAALANWVARLRAEWRAAINYPELNWSKQAKVDQVGAAATLLALELGPPDTTGARPWRACAVGDASLFHVRAGALLATFPVVSDDQFGSAPLLVRSNPGFRTLALAAAGTCEPGDRFVLATDAVAARLLKSAARGAEPDWAAFETVPEADWRAEIDALRRGNDMVNDDCTLVVLAVTGAPEAPTEGPADEAPADAPAEPPLEGPVQSEAPAESPEPNPDEGTP